MKIFIIEDEDNIPTELLEAKEVEVKSAIGWIKLDNPDFKCDCAYRVCQ